MTTGTQTERKLLGTSPSGWKWYLNSTRSWNGANSLGYPPRPKEYQTITIPGRTLLNGTVLPPLTYRKRKWNDLPKRARTLGENNYTLSYEKTAEDHISFNRAWSGYETVMVGHASTLTKWTANDDLVLISKLREAILGSDLNLGVSLAEAPKALSLIGDSARRLALAGRNFRKGNIHAAMNILTKGTAQEGLLKKAPKRSASAWLELQYGWKPLLDDMYNAAVFIHHQTSAPRKVVVSATRFAGGQKVYKDKPFVSSYAGGLSISLNREFTHSKKVRAIIKDASIPSLVGLTDPAAILWELTPYSFVADWVIPIGSYLDALRTVRSINATYVTTEKKREFQHDPIYTFTEPLSNLSWWDRPDDFEYEKLSFSRTVSTTLQVPLPAVKPWAKISTVGHALNAVALLVSAFGSKK